MSMDVEQPSPSSHNEGQAGDNDRNNWRKRLRLRKSSVFSHTVKSQIEEQKVDKELTKETSQNKQKNRQVVDTATHKLTFICSNCKDGIRFSPDGLLKHFKNFHGGKGHSPSFPCNFCSFVAPDFTTLQQHYLKHEHSKLTCEMCNDKGWQTPSQLTKHCKTNNNQYQCEKRKFSAKELTHISHNSCPHYAVPAIDSGQKSEVKPISSEMNRNLGADAAGEPKKDASLKHLTAACHRGWIRKNWWKNRDVAPKLPKHTDPDSKFVIPKAEIPWTAAKFLPFSAAGLLDENGELLNPKRTLEETKQFLERSVNYGQKWPVTLKDEPGPFVSEPKLKRCSTPLPALNSENQLSDLMEKNNISVPPDCTTKVVGFKMVDGKKHLVVKVIPSAKPEVSSDTRIKPAGLTQEERKDKKLDSPIARLSDLLCSNVDDSTAASCQPRKHGLCEEKDQDTMGHAPEVDDPEHDCSNNRSALALSPDASALLALRGIEDVFGAASQTKNINTAFPEITFNANDRHDLGGETIDVPGEVSSVRKDTTLQANMQEIRDTLKHPDNLEEAARDHKEFNSKPSTSQDDRSCIKDRSFGASSDSKSTEDGISSQLFSLMCEKDKRADIYTDKKAGDEAAAIHSPPNDCAEPKVLTLPTIKNGVAMLESDITDPTVTSPQITTTDVLFVSPCEHRSMIFQDGGDQNTNNMNTRYANVCQDQTCTMEAVEEANLALLSLQDSRHNPALYQTLAGLPLTTVSHLLDDSEVGYTGKTSQSEAGSVHAQQECVHSPKAIPVTAATNDKEFSPLRIEPGSRKRLREATSKVSQGLISKSKRPQEKHQTALISYWEPPPPDIERILLLFPFRASQAVKVPCFNQPVVVLNHPDAEIPEVTSIMRSVHRHKGAVQRVVLSQGTLKALSELNCDTFRNKRPDNLQLSHYRRVWPQETVKERFILNLKLKRLGRNKFQVANLIRFSANQIRSSFTCWFCGRHFRNQELWVGHGQRHIMEATLDWNKLS